MTELLGIQLHPFPPLRGNRQYHVQCILQVRQTPSISLHLQDLRRPPLQYQWLWKALHLWPLWSSCLPAKWAPQVLPSSPWAPPNPHEIPVVDWPRNLPKLPKWRIFIVREKTKRWRKEVKKSHWFEENKMEQNVYTVCVLVWFLDVFGCFCFCCVSCVCNSHADPTIIFGHKRLHLSCSSIWSKRLINGSMLAHISSCKRLSRAATWIPDRSPWNHEKLQGKKP